MHLLANTRYALVFYFFSIFISYNDCNFCFGVNNAPSTYVNQTEFSLCEPIKKASTCLLGPLHMSWVRHRKKHVVHYLLAFIAMYYYYYDIIWMFWTFLCVNYINKLSFLKWKLYTLTSSSAEHRTTNKTSSMQTAANALLWTVVMFFLQETWHYINREHGKI